MRKLIIIVFLLQITNKIYSTEYTSQISGEWNSISWNPNIPSPTLNNNDIINIAEGDVVELNGNLEFNNDCFLNVYGSLTINGSFIANNNVVVIVEGDLIINGNVEVKNNAGVTITGTADINGDVDINNKGLIEVDGLLDIEGNLTGNQNNALQGDGVVIADNIDGINTNGFTGYINPSNFNAPNVTGESFTVDEGGTYNTMNLLDNDTDVEGDNLAVTTTAVTPPTKGSLILNANGTFSYTATGDNTGSDSFTYEVCDDGYPVLCSEGTVSITINNVNDAPTAVDDAPPAINEEASITAYNLLANDSDIDGDNLSINTTPISGVRNGSLTITVGGTFNYSPNADFFGTDNFTYRVCDDGSPSLCSDATVTITVNNVNDAPIANDDAPAAIDEGASIIGYSLIANDTDPENDALSITTIAISPVSNGTLTINTDGTFDYSPNADFYGTDQFTYQVCDNGTPSLCATATVSITVNNINDAPIATDDAPAAIDEETSITNFDLLANDSDPENDALTINQTPIINVSNGTLTIKSDGTFDYSPDADYNGTDEFTYQICDNGSPSECANATVTITINNVNDAPIATDDAPLAINEGTSISGFNLLSNDSDIDGDNLTINTTPISPVSYGTLTINGVGTFNYTPNSDFFGTDNFTYEVCDDGTPQLCDEASVTITVNNINDVPVAVDDAPPAIDEETNITNYDLLANDSDADGDLLTVTTIPLVDVSNGTLTINANGTFNYSPDADFFGTDIFTYEVCDNATPKACATASVSITVNNVNDAPTITADGPIVINEEIPITGYDLFGNDSDVDGDNLTAKTSAISDVSHGSLTIYANGTFDYTPAADYYGTDAFTYEACDDGTPSLCNSATVSITINNVNDNPIAVNDAPPAINEETSITNYSLLTNDSDPEGNALAINTTPIADVNNGTLTINANGTFNYTPDVDFYGSDNFQYQVCDNGTASACATATVSITVNNVNDAPNAVNDAPPATGEETPIIGYSILANDSDKEGNTLIINTTPISTVSNGLLNINADGTFNYSPNANFTGLDVFTYEVCDNGTPSACDQATVTITVSNTNDSPTAIDDNPTAIDEETSITGFDLLNNDSDIDGDNITITTTPTSDVSHGSVSINANGTFNYTPNADFFGNDAFQYEICDDGSPSLCATATVTITVNDVNDPPTAIADNPAAINEGASILDFDLLANDSDKEGNNISINTTPVADVTDGSLTIKTDGTFNYTPNADFYGTDGFQYEICDDGSPVRCASAAVTITVNNVNDAPVAVDDTPPAINEGSSITAYDLLANDSDPENDAITIQTVPVANVSNGSLTINTDGTFDYTPNADFFGTDNFTYRICDNGSPSLCATATVTITVNDINDAPIATADAPPAIDEDASITNYNLLANDSDPEGNTITINTTPVSNVSNGSLTINTNGTFTYSPNANFNGTDNFTYQICDNGSPSLCATGSVTITVTPINDNPTIVGESITINEDATISAFNLLANDSDLDGDNIIINTTAVSGVSNGSLTILANGTFNYTPTANYNGSDSFTYEVCDDGSPSLCNSATVNITITPVNDAPNIAADAVSLDEDAFITAYNLLANDSDTDGDNLTINTVSSTGVTNGTLVINANGTFNYTPDANFNGSDLFDYEVCDDGLPSLCNTATVTITVNPINDAPTVVGESVSTNEDIAISNYNIISNDSDIDGNAISINTTPISDVSNGTLVIHPNGTFSYTPDAEFNGSDSFDYKVCDNASPALCNTATVNITVNAVNDPPSIVGETLSVDEDNTLSGTNLLDNDSDIDGNNLLINTTPVINVTNGSLTINANGTFSYTPSLNYNGSDSFEYQVCDDGAPQLCNTAVVDITINPVNDAPTIVDETVWVDEDHSINGFNLHTNDSDIDGDNLAINITPLTDVQHGTLTINTNGTIIYTPVANFNGNDSFEYKVCDDGSPSLCNTATTSIVVNAVNDVPTINSESITINEDETITNYNLLANDTDIDGDGLTINVIPVTAASNGLLTINTNGTFNYTPNANFNGTDSFEYEVCDDNGTPLCATASVTITINAVNDAPTVVSETITINEDETITAYDIISNDSDVDGDNIVINTAPVTDASNASVSILADGTFNYTPNANFNGTDSFEYEICDDDGTPLCTTGSVTITINAVNDAPSVTDESITINEDETITNYDLLANDSDVDGDNISINTTAVTDASNGTLTINGDGTFNYAPNADFNGSDSFEYQVCDDNGIQLCATGTVTITINAVNDAPTVVSETVSVDEDSFIDDYDILSNDSDIDGDNIEISTSLISDPAHGTAIINADGTFDYTPDPDFNGSDSFTYATCDDNASPLCTNGTVSITVNPTNDNPTIVGENITINEDESITDYNLLANDTDNDGDNITINTVAVTPASHGSLTIKATGTFSYSPEADYYGSDSFEYEACDDGSPSLCNTATVSITISPVNDAPVANGDNAYSDPSNTITVNVQANDTDVEENLLTTTITQATVYGNASVLPNNQIEFTADAVYQGSDTLIYQICDNGSPSLCDTALLVISTVLTDMPPVAKNDAATILEDTPAYIKVQANDSDPNGDPLSTVLHVEPAHGTATVIHNDSILYEPDLNYFGSDELQYIIFDTTQSPMSDTATVTITVVNVNDKPIATDNTGFSIDEDNILYGTNIITNDTDIDGNILTISTTPVTNVSNGTLKINTDGTFKYTPSVDYYGSESFEYRVCDNGTPTLCDTAQVSITVNNINDEPVAVDDVAIVDEDNILSEIDIISNDTDIESGTLTINTTPQTDASNGTLTLNADGTFDYEPNPNFNGSDYFKYEVCDDGATPLCDIGRVDITVNSINDKPVAGDDAVTINEDEIITARNLFDNDSDPDGTPFIIKLTPVTDVSNGTLTINVGGTFSYTPYANYFGSDSFEYRMCDNGSPALCDTAEVAITIQSINDKPIANDHAEAINEEESLTSIDLLADISDADGNTLTITKTPVEDVTSGTLTINDDGTFDYASTSNYAGTVYFDYEVCDNGSPILCDTARVEITIANINDRPVAVNDEITIDEDNAITDYSLLDNDTDIEGNLFTMSITPIAPSVDGVLSLKADGTFSYTPAENHYGVDTFLYKMCDNGTPSLCDTAEVRISINNVNDKPVAGNDSYSINEDGYLSNKFVAGNDYDIDNDNLAVNPTPISDVSHGALTLASDGQFNYQPNPNFNGTDSFEYQLCDDGTPSLCVTATATITVNSINDKPVCGDDNITINEGENINAYNLYGNDTDADTNTLTMNISPVSSDVNGTLTLHTDGTFDFVPEADFYGVNTFEYRVCDNGSPTLCDTALVTITINNINDAPIVSNHSITINEDKSISAYDILSDNSDPEGDALTISTTAVANISHGALAIHLDGTFDYRPATNYNGSDEFTYKVCDNGSPISCTEGTVRITIIPVNDKPIAKNDAVILNEDESVSAFNILANDTDADLETLKLSSTPVKRVNHGTISLNENGTFSYTPLPNYFGLDTFAYKVCDNSLPALCDTAEVALIINNVNDTPITFADNAIGNEDIVLNGTSVIANDSDLENDKLTVTATPLKDVQNGTLALNSDGSFIYTPAENFFGKDEFVYEVCDNGSPVKCASDTVYITINSINDKPIATDDNVTIKEDESITSFNLFANDADPDGNSLTATITPINESINGTLNIQPDGTFHFTPQADFFGVNTFEYEMCDNGTPSLCDTALVTISISSVNDNPVAVDDAISVDEDSRLEGFRIIDNDSDIDGNTLTVTKTLISNVSKGSVTVNTDGTIDYTPPANYNGLQYFEYKVCDNGTPSLCDTGKVEITVNSVNDKPTLFNDIVIIEEGEEIVGYNIMANDSDMDGDALTLNIVPITDVENGVLILKSSGVFDYRPGANFSGIVTFEYEACDNGKPSLCDTAKVTITTTNINDKPVAVNDTASTNEDKQIVTFSLLNNDTDFEGNLLSLALTPVRNTKNGTLQLNDDGTFNYTPQENYFGIDSFAYSVCDDGIPSMCDTAEVLINIAPVNDMPIIKGENIVITKGDIISDYDLLKNDSDVDGDELIVNTTPLYETTQGTLTLNTNGTFSYTPQAEFFEKDSFAYEVCDNATPSLCTTAEVKISVSTSNTKPIAINDTLQTLEDIQLEASLLDNDYDIDGNLLLLTTSPLTEPTHGELTLNDDGSIIYTPEENYFGTDAFTYEMCDNALPAKCDTADVFITIESVNDMPTILNDTIYSKEDSLLNEIDITRNDYDVDGDVLTINIIPTTNTKHGLVFIQPDGTFNYVPNTDFNGIDIFEYAMCDNGSPVHCDTAKVSIIVDAINDEPTVENFEITVLEDNIHKGITVYNHIFDADTNELKVFTSESISPKHGSVFFEEDSTFTYTPDAGYVGLDTFAYIACEDLPEPICKTGYVYIRVKNVNDAPMQTIESVIVEEDEPLKGYNLLSTVADVDNDVLTIESVNTNYVKNGTLKNNNGYINYMPKNNFIGYDTVSYKVCDNGSPSLCNTFYLQFNVIPSNDDPIFAEDTLYYDVYNLDTLDICLSFTDADGDTVLLDNILGSEYGSTTYTDSCIQYIAADNYSGTDTLWATCFDGINGYDTAVILITIYERVANEYVDARNDTVTVNGYSTTIDILKNDIIQGIHTVEILHSNFVAQSEIINKKLVYRPFHTYCGSDTVIYKVSIAGSNKADSAKVIITVIPPDSDGDGIADYIEQIPDNDLLNDPFTLENINENNDSDGDGIPNHLDRDSDNDSIPDALEAGTIAENACLFNFTDTDKDGIPDYVDLDSDNDSIPDVAEAGIDTIPVDTDGDGTPDFRDLNSDDDDLTDLEEGTSDCDGNGIPNYRDADERCNLEIKIAEIFTPNNDGKNDAFTVVGIDNYPGSTIVIFNRWGNIVFESNDYQNEWDGTSHAAISLGDNLPEGTYYYILKLGDSNEVYKGYVYLRR